MPKKFEVKSPEKKLVVEFELDLGDNLEEMVERFGDLVVYKLAYEKAKTSAMNLARNMLNNGKSPEEVKKAIEEEWVPVRRLRTVLDINLDDRTMEELANF